jgi:hypothetical protein
MSNSDSADFKVEDRRSSAQQADSNNDAASQETPAHEEVLPDPVMLFSFAALQLETRDLVKALLPVLDEHAWRYLGMVSDPRTGQIRQNLPSAQLAIDCIHFILSKIDSDLSPEEHQESQRRLSDLRMNYLARMRQG